MNTNWKDIQWENINRTSPYEIWTKEANSIDSATFICTVDRITIADYIVNLHNKTLEKTNDPR